MSKQSKIGVILCLVMLLALFMGAGPGIYLVNPDPADPDARRFVFGMPVIWVWVVSWFFVETACVVVAAKTLWKGNSN